MASAPLILQHNWTGTLAIYATVPAQPLLANPVKGISNSRTKGSWIKATNHARIRMHDSDKEDSTIELHLQEHLLLKSPLSKQVLTMRLLTSSLTGSSNILLLSPTNQCKERTAASICYCFRFFDDSDCSGFRQALEAIKSNRHGRLLQRQRQLKQQQLQKQQEHLQQPAARSPQQQAAPEAADTALLPAVVAGPAGAGHAAAPVVDQSGLLQDTGLHVPGASEAHVKDVIKHYLLDPSFQSYVDQIDALWDEVEQEVLQHMNPAETAAMEV